MKNIAIELDFMPQINKIINVKDYNDYFFLQFIHSWLRDGENCNITSLDNKEYKISLFDYWIKKGITSKEFINSFYWNAVSKSPYKVFLPFVKRENNELQLKYINDKEFTIELIAPCKEFYLMIQSRYIVPFDDSGTEILCGEYKIIEKKEKELHLFSPKNNSTIRILVNSNPEVTSEYLNNNKIDISCPSNYSPFVNVKNDKLIKKKGSLVYYLFSKDEVITKIIANNRRIINILLREKIGDFIEPLNSFYENIYDFGEPEDYWEIDYDSIVDNDYVIYYSNYYPNKLLADICRLVLNKYGVNVRTYEVPSYYNFMNECSEYNLYMGVMYPLYESSHAVGMNMLGGLSKENQMRFSKALVDNNVREMWRLLRKIGGFVPLGKGNFWYYKRDDCAIEIDEYGKIHF